MIFDIREVYCISYALINVSKLEFGGIFGGFLNGSCYNVANWKTRVPLSSKKVKWIILLGTDWPQSVQLGRPDLMKQSGSLLCILLL